MAYLSDIDLATLHKKRLEEKNNYKLSSWFNRRFYDEENCRGTYSLIMAEKQRVKTKVMALDKTTTKSKAKTLPIKTQVVESAHNGEDYNHNVNVYDEGCFSSYDRRRSGTWP